MALPHFNFQWEIKIKSGQAKCPCFVKCKSVVEGEMTDASDRGVQNKGGG